MLNLYVKPNCPFSNRVIAANETIKAPLNIIDITEDPAHRAELINKGGKAQVPYLDDVSNGQGMYDSRTIIAYLAQLTGNEIVTKSESVVTNVCPVE